jgi:hypothetical protein
MIFSNFKKNYLQQSIRFLKKDFPFGDFLPPKKKD